MWRHAVVQHGCMICIYSNGNQYSFMKASFYIIVRNGFSMNFSIRGSSARWSCACMAALDIQVSLRAWLPWISRSVCAIQQTSWRTAWRQWKRSSIKYNLDVIQESNTRTIIFSFCLPFLLLWLLFLLCSFCWPWKTRNIINPLKASTLHTQLAVAVWQTQFVKLVLQNLHWGSAFTTYYLKSMLHPWNLKLDYTFVRLVRIHNLVPKQFLCSSDWLMRSELDYFARSLISGLTDGAVTLRQSSSLVIFKGLCSQSLRWESVIFILKKKNGSTFFSKRKIVFCLKPQIYAF